MPDRSDPERLAESRRVADAVRDFAARVEAVEDLGIRAKIIADGDARPDNGAAMIKADAALVAEVLAHADQIASDYAGTVPILQTAAADLRRLRSVAVLANDEITLGSPWATEAVAKARDAFEDLTAAIQRFGALMAREAADILNPDYPPTEDSP